MSSSIKRDEKRNLNQDCFRNLMPATTDDHGGLFCLSKNMLVDDNLQVPKLGCMILDRKFYSLDDGVVFLQSENPILKKQLTESKMILPISSLIAFSKGLKLKVISSESLSIENAIVELSGSGVIYKNLLIFNKG